MKNNQFQKPQKIEYSIIHMAVLNQFLYDHIESKGLLLPKTINPQVSKQTQLMKKKDYHLKINPNLLHQINEIFDDCRPENILVERTNAIYFDLHGKPLHKLEFKSDVHSLIYTNQIEHGYVSNQCMGDFMQVLKDKNVNVKKDNLPTSVAKKIKQCAKEYWAEVLPLEEFLKHYEFAPHEMSGRNWNLKNLKNKSQGLAPCFETPEIIYTKSIPRENLEFYHVNLKN